MDTLSIPEELIHDPEHGVFAGLVVPFGEDPDPEHPHARTFGWADLRMPRKPVPVNIDHGPEEIGLASSWVKTREGIFASLKLGRTAHALIRRGNTALSVEADDGQIIGVALVTRAARPMFSSARIYTHGAVLDPPGALRFGLDPGTGRLAFGSAPTTAPPPRVDRPPMDITAHRRRSAAWGMAPVHASVARDRERWRQRQEELAREPIEREEAALLAAGVPVAAWPAHLPQRRAYAAMLARAEETERRRTLAELTQELSEAPVGVPPKRRWQRWRWWR